MKVLCRRGAVEMQVHTASAAPTARGTLVLHADEGSDSIWPDQVPVCFEDVPVAIARTVPACGTHAAIRENESLYLQAIAAAQYLIYLENQYFASPVIGDALAERLAAPEGPEVIVVSPQRGPNPMRVGSSNLNNRPMGLDTECDIAVDACHVPIHKLESVRRGIREFRDGLIGHYLECTASALARAAQREGCYAGAIRSLCDINRNHLRRVVPRRLGLLRSLIAEFHLGDPEGSGRRHGASVPPRSRW